MKTGKNYKRAAFIIFVLIIFTLSGCWDRREIQNITVNTALGFDRVQIDGEAGFRIAVLSIKPAVGGSSASGQSGGAKTPGARVITAQGKTIYDAVRNWNLRSPRQLVLSHSLLIVMGEELAKQKEMVVEVLDFLSRHREVRERVWVLVTAGTALEALEVQPEFEVLTSIEIAKVIQQNSARVSKTVTADLFQFTYDYLTPGRDPIVSRLQTFTAPEESTALYKQGGSSGESGASKVKTLRVAGAAVFSAGKFAGWMEETEAQGALFIKGEASGGVIPIKFNNGNVSLLIHESTSRIEPVVGESGLVINVLVKGVGDLHEEAGQLKISAHEFAMLENSINREMERKCYMAVNKSRELKADVFGFGDKVHRHHPQLWKSIEKEWRQIFPALSVNIKADFKIENYGLIKESYQATK